VVIGLLALVASACGATDNGGALGPSRNISGTTLPSGALQGRLPGGVARAGVLHVGVLASSPPYAVAGSDGQPLGLEIDLIQAVARVLGLKAAFVSEGAPALGAGLGSHQLDLIVGGFVDTVAARTRGTHFVDYLRGASAVVVRQGNPSRVAGAGDLCGRTVGFVDTTAPGAARLIGACAASGRPVRVVGPLPVTQLATAVGQGQADAAFEDSLAANYVAQASAPPAELAVLDGVSDPVLHGLALGDASLAPALQAAVQATMGDGTYTRLVDRWGAQGWVVSSASIDAGA